MTKLHWDKVNYHVNRVYNIFRYEAVEWFEKMLGHITGAHAYRKLRSIGAHTSTMIFLNLITTKDSEAILYYESVLTLSTKSLSTYSGLAYTYHLQVL